MNPRVCIVAILLTFIFSAGIAQAQNCVDCSSFRSVQAKFVSSPKVERYQTTEMVKAIKMVPTEVEVPMTRTFETVTTTREIYDGGAREMLRRRRVGFMNWGCVATAVGAYFDCSMAKRGERKGLLKRLLFFRR